MFGTQDCAHHKGVCFSQKFGAVGGTLRIARGRGCKLPAARSIDRNFAENGTSQISEKVPEEVMGTEWALYCINVPSQGGHRTRSPGEVDQLHLLDQNDPFYR